MKKPVGRPSIENKRVTLSVKIKPELKLWLELQPESKGAAIEKLIEEQIKSFM